MPARYPRIAPLGVAMSNAGAFIGALRVCWDGRLSNRRSTIVVIVEQMVNTAQNRTRPEAPALVRRRAAYSGRSRARLAADRERQILAGAVDFFARLGLGAQSRELAAEIGVTHALGLPLLSEQASADRACPRDRDRRPLEFEPGSPSRRAAAGRRQAVNVLRRVPARHPQARVAAHLHVLGDERRPHCGPLFRPVARALPRLLRKRGVPTACARAAGPRRARRPC